MLLAEDQALIRDAALAFVGEETVAGDRATPLDRLGEQRSGLRNPARLGE